MHPAFRVLAAALFTASFASPCVAQTAVAARSHLMPQPRAMQFASGAGFPIQSGLTVALAGARSARLQDATLRALKRMEDRTGLPLPRAIADAKTGSITLTVQGDGEAVQGLNEDESYRLMSSGTGVAIDAATTHGRRDARA